jgi:hypothetical protein
VEPRFLGTPLPTTPLHWLLLLSVILISLGGVLTVVEQALLLTKTRTRFRPYGGFAVPLGWALWSALLLIADRHTFAVLVVLLGSLMILIAIKMLTRDCRA